MAHRVSVKSRTDTMMISQRSVKPGTGLLKSGVNRSALGEITNKDAKPFEFGKSIKPLKPRQTKVAARRLLLAPETNQMEVDDTDVVEESYQDILSNRVTALAVQLPTGVVDIDSEDLDNPQLCSEYAPAMYAYLRSMEEEFSIQSDYLSGYCITPKMRSVLIDWLVDVQQQFNLLPETLYLTVSILDRFLSGDSGKDVHRSKLQLVGISAMFIASKIEEIYAPELNDFVYITDNAYTSAEVRSMELNIFKALNYHFGKPLSINFLRRYSKAGDVDVTEHAMAKYILEAILLDYSLVSVNPSMAAATSLYLSLCILGMEVEDKILWTQSLHHYTGYTQDQVHEQAHGVAGALKTAHTGKYAAIRQKFSSSVMQRIARNPALESKLRFL
ncbi:G2/mitotic-specific cyclin-B [Eurytemora carolleeae]|uniref:G2/mitotic-specific cyclin-B n=1 Tax=Eurytemora carolleeae TaxID=1294199 RepID=UPI000C7868AF|nr:G2/mitotic-specific cyclin-B [Eurytemora carolleeae]|eukprot:XP_023330482.1 G2/mitotic-specific cyclin-B-like [Eurytemora affinis]